jgi:glycosyltransferase involved in cell wall biosynthesis
VTAATLDFGDGRGSYGVPLTTTRSRRLYTTERPFAPPLLDPEGALALRRIIGAERPDVVHAHDWLARSLPPRRRGRAPAYVVTLHDYSHVCATKRLVRAGTACAGPEFGKCVACASHYYGSLRGLATTLGNRAGAALAERTVDMFLPVSTAVAVESRLAERGLPYRVVPNFVGDELTGDADEGLLARLPVEPFILFAGDVTADKGVDVLLDAYGRLREAPPLVLIGRRRQAASELPPNVIALGALPHEAVIAALNRCLVAVVPSIVPDACPTVLIEAMAAARPVVAAASGGIVDLVDDGADGLLVPPNDVPALASALQRLLLSPELREQISEAARRRSAEFRASAVVPRIEAVYLELVGAATRARLAPAAAAVRS